MSLEIQGPQPFFEDVVDHMSAICKAPIAVVVLLNPHRQWVSGVDGEKGGEVDPARTFDARALMGVAKAVVCDPGDSETFAPASLDAQRSGIRSFIAQPMHHDGEVVGHIYLADTRPREWLPSEVAYLERAERLMVSQVEARAIIAERDRRIALEQELAKVGKLHSAIVSSMTEGVAVMDGEGKILASNPAALAMLGLTEAEFHGRTPMHPEWRFLNAEGKALPNEDNVALVALRTRKPQLGVVLAVNRPSGEMRWLQVNSVPLFNAGRDAPYGVVSTFRDITEERARAEELNEALARSEQAVAAKQRFLANMSHEIRTPLNGVVGIAQALRTTALDAEQEDLVATILDSGASMMTLLNDVLDMSKIEAGKFEIVREEHDLTEFVRRLIKLWRPRAEEKGLQLSFVIDAGLPKRLSFDAIRAQQCLNNLLSNAVKFTKAGEISLVVASRPVADDEHLVEARVRDTGIGMDEIALARLFQPFTQADENISRLHGGTGLGLSITRKLAELMGGEAWGSSRLGQGSEFGVSFRGSTRAKGVFGKPSGVENPAEAVADDEPRKLRVLVVDDNAINRQVAVLFLKPLEATTVQATNGEEALAALEAEPFDIVLLDMHMPVLDGPGTIVRIRASERDWSAIPVVAVTADAMSGDRERYLAMGMDGYLPKPLDADDLLSEIERLTGLPMAAELAMTG